MASADRRAPARIRIERSAFRQLAPDLPPLWHSAGLGGTPQQPAGRWHRDGHAFAQYLAASPAGAWAELIRYLHLRSPEAVAEQRRALWQVYVRLDDIADLSTFDLWAASGLDPAAAVADDHSACQDIADWLTESGYRGVLAPSAALPGSTNLTIFGERYEHETTDDPGALPARDPNLWLPVALAAAGAHPPRGLVTRTRYVGQPHGGLDDWRGNA